MAHPRAAASASPYWFMMPSIAGGLLSGFLLLLAGDEPLWRTWSARLPHSDWPVFGDLAITLGHIREAARGLDPLSDEQSAFAYPRLVLALHHTGIQNVAAPWLGFIQSAATVAGLIAVLKPATPTAAVAVTALFFTPPIFLGFERANLDFMLFLLCAVAARIWSRSDGVAGVIPSAFLVGVAALLKLHPVFAMFGGAVADRGRRRHVWLLALAAVALYWAGNRAEMELIAQKIPVSAWGSWGCQVFFVRLERFVAASRDSYVWLADVRWPLIASAIFAAAGAVAYAIGARLGRHFARVPVGRREWCYYWMGASICCGSFAGANFAYRWIFVLLTIPLLVQLARSAGRLAVGWSQATSIALVASLLAPLHTDDRNLFLLIQAANWTGVLLLFFGCGALTAARAMAPATHPTAERTEAGPGNMPNDRRLPDMA